MVTLGIRLAGEMKKKRESPVESFPTNEREVRLSAG
jgi:hypothetical protein